MIKKLLISTCNYYECNDQTDYSKLIGQMPSPKLCTNNNTEMSIETSNMPELKIGE